MSQTYWHEHFACGLFTGSQAYVLNTNISIGETLITTFIKLFHATALSPENKNYRRTRTNNLYCFSGNIIQAFKTNIETQM